MKKYWNLLAGLAVASLFILGGCTAANEASAKAAAQAAFSKICAAEPGVYTLTQAIVATGKLRQSVVNTLDAKHVVVTSLCENPPTDVVSALVTLASDYALIYSIYHQNQPAAPS